MCFCNIFLLINFLVLALGMTPEEQKRHPNFKLLPQPPDCSIPVSIGRIIGGKETALGQFPWIAQLGFMILNCPELETQPIYYDCGSSLITPTVLLTAAHCVDVAVTFRCQSTDLYEHVKVGSVKLGEWDQHSPVNCMRGLCALATQIILVDHIIVHRGHIPEYNLNDIAMVVLETPAEITGWVNPVCLPTGSMLSKSFLGEMAEVIGWGRTTNARHDSSVQGILKSVDVPIVKNDSCKNLFRNYGNVPDSIICAGGEKAQDSCSGDSGGPLMVYDDEGEYEKKYIIGIVSFGALRCGSRGQSAVYTRITSFMSWILDYIED